ncbi:hypothetical protein ADUPG1_010199, partial [Aduncisulcus paluster]
MRKQREIQAQKELEMQKLFEENRLSKDEMKYRQHLVEEKECKTEAINLAKTIVKKTTKRRDLYSNVLDKLFVDAGLMCEVNESDLFSLSEEEAEAKKEWLFSMLNKTTTVLISSPILPALANHGLFNCLMKDGSTPISKIPAHTPMTLATLMSPTAVSSYGNQISCQRGFLCSETTLKKKRKQAEKKGIKPEGSALSSQPREVLSDSLPISNECHFIHVHCGNLLSPYSAHVYSAGSRTDVFMNEVAAPDICCIGYQELKCSGGIGVSCAMFPSTMFIASNLEFIVDDVDEHEQLGIIPREQAKHLAPSDVAASAESSTSSIDRIMREVRGIAGFSSVLTHLPGGMVEGGIELPDKDKEEFHRPLNQGIYESYVNKTPPLMSHAWKYPQTLSYRIQAYKEQVHGSKSGTDPSSQGSKPSSKLSKSIQTLVSSKWERKPWKYGFVYLTHPLVRVHENVFRAFIISSLNETIAFASFISPVATTELSTLSQSKIVSVNSDIISVVINTADICDECLSTEERRRVRLVFLCDGISNKDVVDLIQSELTCDNLFVSVTAVPSLCDCLLNDELRGRHDETIPMHRAKERSSRYGPKDPSAPERTSIELESIGFVGRKGEKSVTQLHSSHLPFNSKCYTPFLPSTRCNVNYSSQITAFLTQSIFVQTDLGDIPKELTQEEKDQEAALGVKERMKKQRERDEKKHRLLGFIDQPTFISMRDPSIFPVLSVVPLIPYSELSPISSTPPLVHSPIPAQYLSSILYSSHLPSPKTCTPSHISLSHFMHSFLPFSIPKNLAQQHLPTTLFDAINPMSDRVLFKKSGLGSRKKSLLTQASQSLLTFSLPIPSLLSVPTALPSYLNSLLLLSM